MSVCLRPLCRVRPVTLSSSSAPCALASFSCVVVTYRPRRLVLFFFPVCAVVFFSSPLRALLFLRHRLSSSSSTSYLSLFSPCAVFAPPLRRLRSFLRFVVLPPPFLLDTTPCLRLGIPPPRSLPFASSAVGLRTATVISHLLFSFAPPLTVYLIPFTPPSFCFTAILLSSSTPLSLFFLCGTFVSSVLFLHPRCFSSSTPHTLLLSRYPVILSPPSLRIPSSSSSLFFLLPLPSLLDTFLDHMLSL